MSILDDIKAEVGAAFADPGLFFSEASVTRTVSVTPGGSGWIEGTPSVQAYPCYAMIDTYSDHLRAVQDIPDTHVKLMVLGASLEVDLLKGDTVTIGAKAWRIMGPVQKDPAGAVWTAQAAPV